MVLSQGVLAVSHSTKVKLYSFENIVHKVRNLHDVVEFQVPCVVYVINNHH